MTDVVTRIDDAKQRLQRPEREPTEYVVLEHHDVEITNAEHKLEDVSAWVEIGRSSQKGRNGRPKAIAAIAGERSGTFKAVEAKGWDTGEERMEQTMMVGRPLAPKGAP